MKKMFKKKITKKIACPKCGKIVEVQGYPEEKIKIKCNSCGKSGVFIFPNDIAEQIDILNLIEPEYLLLLVPIFVSNFLLNNQDITTFLSFIIMIPIFYYFKLNAKIPIFYALSLFAISMVIIGFNLGEKIANQFIIYAYWLLIVGVTCLIIQKSRK